MRIIQPKKVEKLLKIATFINIGTCVWAILIVPIIFQIIKPELWMVIVDIIIVVCGFATALYIANDVDKYMGGLSNKEKFKKMLTKIKRRT